MGAGEVLLALALAGKLLEFVAKAKANAAKTGEWTPEERQAVEEAYKRQIESKAFLTDAEGG